MVTVTAAADADAVVPPEVDLTNTVSGGDYAGEPAASVTVRTTEGRVPGLTLSPSAVSVSESVGGNGQTLTMTLSVASSETVTMSYATSDGTATSGADYTATSGTLTFAPGEPLTQTFSVPILGDALDEDDETFTVSLGSAVNATAGPAAAVTITDERRAAAGEPAERLHHRGRGRRVAGGDGVTVGAERPRGTGELRVVGRRGQLRGDGGRGLWGGERDVVVRGGDDDAHVQRIDHGRRAGRGVFEQFRLRLSR